MRKRSLMFALFTLSALTSWATEANKDINGDKTVDNKDVKALAEAILSGTEDITTYDIDGDGNVNVGDIIALINYIEDSHIGFGGDDNKNGIAEAKKRN